MALRAAVAVATAILPSALLADVKLLPPEEAFRFAARAIDAQVVEARFTVADGYYLYRDKIRFSASPAFGLVAPTLPGGQVKEDEFFGRVETFRREVLVRLALPEARPGASVVIEAESQGCADVGVCYPLTRQKVAIVLPATGARPGSFVEASPAKKAWFK